MQVIFRGQCRASAECAALQSRNGIAESHAFLDIFFAQHSVDESGMKSIARAGRVATSSGDCERRRFDELTFAVNDRAARAERSADNRVAVASVCFDECRAQVTDAGQSMWKFG